MRNVVRGLFLVGWALGLVWWEEKRTLRPRKYSKLVRDTRNLSIAALAGLTMQILELPVALSLARQAKAKRWGLTQALPLPEWARMLCAVLLLDYTLYWWHFLTHRVPVLWRFHEAHHVDREMDATTALRFHFGEIAISVAFRAAQVFVIGVSPAALTAWQSFLFCCILFHHANILLPIRWERRISRLVITPRLHGIHHSVRSNEVNSNWSSGLTIWDSIHGTLLTEVPQGSITIGVVGRLDDTDQELINVLSSPFRSPSVVPPISERPPRQRAANLGC